MCSESRYERCPQETEATKASTDPKTSRDHVACRWRQIRTMMQRFQAGDLSMTAGEEGRRGGELVPSLSIPWAPPSLNRTVMEVAIISIFPPGRCEPPPSRPRLLLLRSWRWRLFAGKEMLRGIFLPGDDQKQDTIQTQDSAILQQEAAGGPPNATIRPRAPPSFPPQGDDEPLDSARHPSEAEARAGRKSRREAEGT